MRGIIPRIVVISMVAIMILRQKTKKPRFLRRGLVSLGNLARIFRLRNLKGLNMHTIDYHGTTICVLEEHDMLTDCPIGAYAVIEDSGFYVAVHVEESNAPAIHTDPVETLESALDIIAEQLSFFA
ncbi:MULTISPECIES: hypothetical protein [Pectobacterium]|uniref:hypothetical protein n=1 Tax=Pectobacterium TaxID=122277 RepID=UPI001F3B7D8B|nr:MULTISPECIES: hypothetical protein [Pectobacterium]